MKYFSSSNWGEDLSFNVPEEDILQERPAPLALQALEINPPAWAMLCVRKMGGHRHDKRRVIYTDTYSQNWHGQTYDAYVHGPLACPTPQTPIERAIVRRNRKKGGKGVPDMPSARKMTPVGNLHEEDYRFWKGHNLESMPGAVCRWCNFSCVAQREMKSHFRNHPCKEYLLALYKYAKQGSQQRYCFSCKQVTKAFRWGIPLCNSVSCLTRWKFAGRDSWHGLTQYREWARERQYQDPVNGPFADISIITTSEGH